jgi:hypothetical protein
LFSFGFALFAPLKEMTVSVAKGLQNFFNTTAPGRYRLAQAQAREKL